jgi:thiamine-monophosphate kinase
VTELDVIRALAARLCHVEEGEIGIGDDAALVKTPGRVLVTTDSMVEGVHFRRDWSTWSDVAFKLIARNASDIWAMGGEVDAWFLSLVLPSTFGAEQLAELADGFVAAATEFGTTRLMGGDTAVSGMSGCCVLSVTMLGRPGVRVVRRDTAAPGQALWVDGPLGHAACGLWALREGVDALHPGLVEWHRRPRPRRIEPSALAAIECCIDVSDGLLRDAGRLAEASGVHVELDAPWEAVAQLEARGVPGEISEAAVLSGGDDYCRLATAVGCPGPGWLRVGRVLPGGPALTLVYPDGTRRAVKGDGYLHTFRG